MGVLDAWKNAEKITYPVVGETQKNADNVIDYDIREEQTKDISAEINANNQTTTGMATVIPGVNAPKLLESTSIISTPVPGYIYAVVTFRGPSVGDGITTTMPVRAISGQVGEPPFTKTGANNRFLRIPAAGVYKLEFTLPASTSNYYINYRVFTDEKGNILNRTSGSGDADVILTLEMKKGELISSSATVMGLGGWSGTTSPFIYMDITRLG